MNNTKVTVIIVHWNTSEKLKKLLSLVAVNNSYQVIVVDNNSKKRPDWLKSNYSPVELMQNGFNRGYAAACNQGMTKALGDCVLVLNPDVEITPSQIDKLIIYAKTNDLDACSVRTTESYRKPLPSWGSLLVEFTPLAKIFPLDIFKTKTLFGGCLLLKKSVIKKLGGFDERFFLWFEDSDITKRLIDNDYKIGWFDLPIKHSGGESFKLFANQLKRDIFFSAMEIYANKHFSAFGKLIIYLLKRKYSTGKLLPHLQNITSITVPNLKTRLLGDFFKKNQIYIDLKSGYTLQVEWIVVTSSITNSHVWQWRRKYPGVRFIPIDNNKGFASTANIGFRASSGNWLGTVNDDVLLTKDWLKNLLSSADNLIGSLNPVIKKPGGEIESMGVKILPKGKAESITENRIASHRSTTVSKNKREVDATNAACVIYSKSALNKVGIFAEKFGSYLEDIDLSLRLKSAGFKNLVSPDSVVIHFGQSTSKDLRWKKQYLDCRNWFLVILRNWSVKDLIINFPAILLERLKNISGLLKAVFNLF